LKSREPEGGYTHQALVRFPDCRCRARPPRRAALGARAISQAWRSNIRHHMPLLPFGPDGVSGRTFFGTWDEGNIAVRGRTSPPRPTPGNGQSGMGNRGNGEWRGRFPAFDEI